MLTAAHLKALTNEELARALYVEQDALTSSDAEVELLTRFEALLDEQSANQPIADLIGKYEVSAADMKAVIESHPGSLKDQAALLALLNGEDIHEPDQLKELLDLVSKFRALASDAGDFFTRLNDLVTTQQE